MHCIALANDGSIFAYGKNYNGRLGLGKGKFGVTSFTEIMTLKNSQIKSVYGGYYHSLFLTENGKVFACGSNACNELMLGPDWDSGDLFDPTETTVENASFCIAGHNSSIVFKNYEPEMCPNKPITEKEMKKNQSRTFSPLIKQPIKNNEEEEVKEKQKPTIPSHKNSEEEINEIEKLKKENEILRNKLSLANSIWLYQNTQNNDEIFFIDDEEEKFHKVIEKVGEGATSITFKVIDTRTDSIMCKKVLKVDPENPPTMTEVKKIIKEFEVLKSINHPCICGALYINTQETVKDASVENSEECLTIALFLEFLEIDLNNLLQDGLNNTLKTRIVVEISHALNYLHENGMIHRDLKIENILLNSVYQAKLVDFGLVRIHECLQGDYSFVDESMSKGVGTLAYMSPEMVNEEDYDYKTDVYSFGVILHYMFIGDYPKQSMKDKMYGKEVKLPNPSSLVSEFGIELIKKCMSNDPNNRPTFQEILEELREKEYSLAPSIDKSLIHQRDMELSLFETK